MKILFVILLGSFMMSSAYGQETEWKSYNVTGPPNSKIVQPIHPFKFQYKIANGTIDSFQVQNYEFIIKTHSKNNGIFEIKVPRNFPYYNGKDGPSNQETYLIVKNMVPIPPSYYYKTVSDCYFTYSVPINTNSTITIMSTDIQMLMTPIYGDKVPSYCEYETRVIPEFPVAPVVLLAGFVSVIIIFKKHI